MNLERFLSRLLSLTLMLALLGMGSVVPAFAQANTGAIALTPLLAEMNIELGERYERSVIVENVNSQPYQITFEALDVEIESQSHKVTFLPAESKGNTSKSMASWIDLVDAETFTLEAGERRVVEYVVEVPSEVSGDSDYFASLNFYYEPVDQNPLGNRAIKVRQSMGTLLLATLLETAELVGADDQADLVVSDLEISTRAGEAQISLRAFNALLRYMSPLPRIVISNAEGEVVYDIEPLSQRIFPGEEATLEYRFPQEYVDSVEPLTLRFELRDRLQQQVLFEHSEAIGGKGPFFDYATFQTVRFVFVVALGLLVLLIAISFVRNRKR